MEYTRILVSDICYSPGYKGWRRDFEHNCEIFEHCRRVVQGPDVEGKDEIHGTAFVQTPIPNIQELVCLEKQEILVGQHRGVRAWKRKVPSNFLHQFLKCSPKVEFINQCTECSLSRDVIIGQTRYRYNSFQMIFVGKPMPWHIEQSIRVTWPKPFDELFRGKDETFWAFEAQNFMKEIQRIAGLNSSHAKSILLNQLQSYRVIRDSTLFNAWFEPRSYSMREELLADEVARFYQADLHTIAEKLWMIPTRITYLDGWIGYLWYLFERGIGAGEIRNCAHCGAVLMLDAHSRQRYCNANQSRSCHSERASARKRKQRSIEL